MGDRDWIRRIRDLVDDYAAASWRGPWIYPTLRVSAKIEKNHPIIIGILSIKECMTRSLSRKLAMDSQSLDYVYRVDAVTVSALPNTARIAALGNLVSKRRLRQTQTWSIYFPM